MKISEIVKPIGLNSEEVEKEPNAFKDHTCSIVRCKNCKNRLIGTVPVITPSTCLEVEYVACAVTEDNDIIRGKCDKFERSLGFVSV